jgi:Domain of unknown function (DUF6321)
MPLILSLNSGIAEFRRQSTATRRKISRALKGRRRGSKLKDPRGGLTPAGRRFYREKFGNNLKPGVTRKGSKMSLQDMRRKGSWASRMYGRQNLPPLVKPNGEPTRMALQARAWGEPVPRSPEAARRIGAKGRRLLTRYQRLKARRGR